MALRCRALASVELLKAVKRKGRTIVFAEPDSEEKRYLHVMNANANVGGERLTHMILQKDVRHVELLEEFLHGTQERIGLVDQNGLVWCERHVKKFMIQHQEMLEISDEDRMILEQMLGDC